MTVGYRTISQRVRELANRIDAYANLDLRHEVKTKLFGQHLAEEVVLKAVRAHINKA